MPQDTLPSPPPDATLLPRSGDDFLAQWGALPGVAELTIPFALRAGDGARAPSQSEIFDHIDVGGSVYREADREWTVGIVATDPRLFVDAVVTARLPTAIALRRYFHADQLDGVAFNPRDEYSAFASVGHVLLRFGLPRLIGLVESPDREARAASHAALAVRLLRADGVYAAHYHAVLARERGAPLDSFYFSELDSLRRLALWEAFQSYRAWYATQGGRRLRLLDLFGAPALTASGQAQQALEAAQPFLGDPEFAARAWLETGRARHALGRLEQALEAFERSLTLEPNLCETLLGKGIALRGLHWESGDRQGLSAAAACFEQVRAEGDYSVPEATHHLATIRLAEENWPEVERLSREAMRLRKSPVSRRNLCLALHAQGRIDEGGVEYAFLCRHAPDQAEPLHKYYGR